MTPKFKIGDLVRCTNPKHPGTNPFEVLDIEPSFNPPRYYGHMGGTHFDEGMSIGCRESELQLVKPSGQREEK